MFLLTCTFTILTRAANRSSVVHQMFEMWIELVQRSELAMWVAVYISVNMLAVRSLPLKSCVSIWQLVQSVCYTRLWPAFQIVDPFIRRHAL